MLQTACSDKAVHDRLEALLILPDGKRQGIVHAWVTDLLIAEAPRDFIQAVACLEDDRVAEKAYEAIFDCSGAGRVTPGIQALLWALLGLSLIGVSLVLAFT